MQSNSQPQQFDITGVVVRVRPDQCEPIVRQLRQLRGVEVHAMNDNGNLVVTIEELDGEKLALDTLATINQIPGVLSTSMVYHHTDQESH